MVPPQGCPIEAAPCRYATQYVFVLAEYELPATRDDYVLLNKLAIDFQQPS